MMSFVCLLLALAITAGASQYRETLALEEAFRKDASSESRWIARQDEQIVENTHDFDDD